MRLVPVRSYHRHSLALALFVALGIVSPFVRPMGAEAVDLTGTWNGKAICKGLFAGNKTSDTFAGHLFITQTGPDLNMNFLGVLYNGAFQEDNTAPTRNGQGTFVACSTTTDYSAYSEIASFTAKLNPNLDTASTFKATSVYYTGADNFQTCRWTFKRIDTTNPLPAGVPPCP
jgi:hypothetical protein